MACESQTNARQSWITPLAPVTSGSQAKPDTPTDDLPIYLHLEQAERAAIAQRSDPDLLGPGDVAEALFEARQAAQKWVTRKLASGLPEFLITLNAFVKWRNRQPQTPCCESGALNAEVRQADARSASGEVVAFGSAPMMAKNSAVRTGPSLFKRDPATGLT